MVLYSVAGCVEHNDYTICERLLDIMVTALPDITAEKEPCLHDLWQDRALEIAQLNGFACVGGEATRVPQVLVWRHGRLIAHRSEEFALYVLQQYALELDLGQEQVEAYTKANTATARLVPSST
ncbi:Aste57867_18648 [Aphanomyces stellatus]|uniref:Aste57867_18648 protein n=1 Tax=Aphanomyces stellatus TaxID=120398 RepID=A0A485LB95_9STRA|nr:hypothetical protein As57867_018586 [Aphanomyces stellatus]VFT95383.1 Aste57867_18648 [Aphanomyces stellatus]